MLIRSQTTTPFQIVCECSLYTQVIFKSMRVADDFFLTYSEHKWAKHPITLTMLRLLSSKAQGCKDYRRPSKPCHIGIHWIALAEHSDEYLCARVSIIFSDFCKIILAKLASSSIRVNRREVYLSRGICNRKYRPIIAIKR